MAGKSKSGEKDPAKRESSAGDGTPPEAVAGGSQWHPLTTAILVGGAVAATAGAYLGTRALARRNSEAGGKPVNSVMAAAITACDLAHNQSGEPSAAEIIVDDPDQPPRAESASAAKP
jgi:hypothetical protein